MKDEKKRQERPARAGLPLDPLLQLWGGEVTTPVVYTVGASGSIQVAIPDPMRVALYVVRMTGLGGYRLSPFKAIAGTVIVTDEDAAPAVIHCRDYPGIVQADWYITAGIGDTFTVYSYRLADHWGL